MEQWLEIYIYINLFIIGTLFGSFFSLATYRIPRKKDIVSTRSFCVNCNHNLGFFDLIPVLSYVVNLGKCRYCKQKISIRYPIYEILSGIYFILMYYIFSFSIYLILSYVIYIILVLYIGSNISKRKMKKGLLYIEVIIGFAIFAVVITSTYISSKNYINSFKDDQIDMQAYKLALTNTELSLGTKYDSLSSSNYTTDINGITYEIYVNVSKYSDDFLDKQDVIKKINTKVKYTYNYEEKEIEINSIKKKV